MDSQHSGSMMRRFDTLFLAWTSSWTNRWMKDDRRCHVTWVTFTVAVYCHFNVFVQTMPIILGLATRVMPVLCNPLTWVLNINGQRLSPCGILLGQDNPDYSMLLAHKPGVLKVIIKHLVNCIMLIVSSMANLGVKMSSHHTKNRNVVILELSFRQLWVPTMTKKLSIWNFSLSVWAGKSHCGDKIVIGS